MRNNRSNAPKPLSILQINVGRGATAHEIALALGNESLIDIILIQKPYIFIERTEGRDSTPVRGVPYEPAMFSALEHLSIAEPSLSHFEWKPWCQVRSRTVRIERRWR